MPLANLRSRELLLRAVCAAAAGGLVIPLRALLERSEVDVHAKCGEHSVREGVTALHVAAELGHVRAVELLLKAGANVNDEGEPPHNKWTPLMFAARWGNAGAVTTLLEAKADAGAQLTRAMDFRTALQIAESPGPGARRHGGPPGGPAALARARGVAAQGGEAPLRSVTAAA